MDGLYSLPYLQPEPQKNEKLGYLTQSEWWELLFFIKKLDICEQQPVLQRLRENLDEVHTPKTPRELVVGLEEGLEVGLSQGVLDTGVLGGSWCCRLGCVRGPVGGGDKCFEGLAYRRCAAHGRGWPPFHLLSPGPLCLLIPEMYTSFC